MISKNLVDEFNIKEETPTIKQIADYDIFKDKELLDNLRNTIISNIIDDKVPEDKLLHEYINEEIEKHEPCVSSSCQTIEYYLYFSQCFL